MLATETLRPARHAPIGRSDAKTRRAIGIAFNTFRTVALTALGFAAMAASIIGARVVLHSLGHQGTPFADTVLRGLGL
jgi:hypothetical protein